MKKILFALFILLCSTTYATKWYLAPTTATPAGSDANAGTISAPFFTLDKLWTVISAGDTAYLRGGTYRFLDSQYLTGKSGTAGNLIKIWAYASEVPILTYAVTYSENELIWFVGDYVHWKGFEIIGAPQRAGEYGYSGMKNYGVNNCIFERINYHHSAAPFDFTGDCDDNLILNCDFHDNADALTSYGNADGLDIHFINSGNSNTVRGCRAWNNVDDGFDCWENAGYVLFDSCWSWHNGYIPGTETEAGNGCGFKLGRLSTDLSTTLLRTMQNCITSQNRTFGVTENNTLGIIHIYNCTAYNNGNAGFVINASGWGHDIASILRNNISFNNLYTAWIEGTSTIVDHNTFSSGINQVNSSYTVTSADFVNLTFSQLQANRKANGDLPNITYLTLVYESDLINTGIDVGLPYIGIAPDMGAFEFGNTTYTTPVVTTTAISSITTTTAMSGGNITDDGDTTVTARGVCWGTSSNPTILNSHTSDSSGTGVFTSNITGLSSATTYHVRAYATNSEGTAYGVDRTFTTLVFAISDSTVIKNGNKVVKHNNKRPIR